jgi:hypothetical protein
MTEGQARMCETESKVVQTHLYWESSITYSEIGTINIFMKEGSHDLITFSKVPPFNIITMANKFYHEFWRGHSNHSMLRLYSIGNSNFSLTVCRIAKKDAE